MTPDDSPTRPRRPIGGSGAEVRIGERLIALFILGVLMFNPLVIGLFDRGIDVTVLGLPLLYAYIFAAWAVLIALLAHVIERAPADGTPRRPRSEESDA